MPTGQLPSIKADEARAKILAAVSPDDFKWAIPIMRAGYGGRAMVYCAVAIISLLSVWQGGEAQGTEAALRSLDGGWGTLVVALIAAGLFAYAIWRAVDSFYDLEAYGWTLKGVIARAGMVVTGLAHAGIGVLAITALGLARSADASGGGGGTQSLLRAIMGMQGGTWIIGIAGGLTVAAGIYYLHKAFQMTYLESLRANHFTRNWNWMLRLGVVAQGVLVGIIGGLLIFAAIEVDPSEAGGLGSVFDWLRDRAFGRILVVALCVGLLAFALFCLVNALFRIVPKAMGDDVQSAAEVTGA
ncbi:DUF1206 domain-containing protein [Hasllibacter sp. MH4015]|uniref:DUF1206 domain-containing protein n=1 Tax=Hasllibacter sp. MH4015 TaxID=2854029 RepID=UPI001CD3BC8F|nr:DUF1206 domain-containing protein [Hasllibacter sp. MH4015]